MPVPARGVYPGTLEHAGRLPVRQSERPRQHQGSPKHPRQLSARRPPPPPACAKDGRASLFQQVEAWPALNPSPCRRRGSREL
eukprot:scaffold25754_cov104-Isochrysis_galbana.AAC.3